MSAIIFTTKWTGVDNYRQRLDKVGKALTPAITSAIRPICKKIMAETADAIENKPPFGGIATGDLVNALRTADIKVTDRSNKITINFGDTPDANIPFYGNILEFGAKPHFPPIARILAWMQQRGMGQDRKIAYAICVKISREGLPQFDFFEKAYNNNIDALQEALEQALQTVMESI